MCNYFLEYSHSAVVRFSKTSTGAGGVWILNGAAHFASLVVQPYLPFSPLMIPNSGGQFGTSLQVKYGLEED